MPRPTPSQITPRAAFYGLRSAFREAVRIDAAETARRHADAHCEYRDRWVPYWPCMDAENAVRPQIEALPPAIRAAILFRADPNDLLPADERIVRRLPRGPKASAFHRYGRSGREHLELHRRVAVRRAIAQSAAYERSLAAERAASVCPTGGAAFTGRGAAGGCAQLDRAA